MNSIQNTNVIDERQFEFSILLDFFEKLQTPKRVLTSSNKVINEIMITTCDHEVCNNEVLLMEPINETTDIKVVIYEAETIEKSNELLIDETVNNEVTLIAPIDESTDDKIEKECDKKLNENILKERKKKVSFNLNNNTIFYYNSEKSLENCFKKGVL